METMTRFFEGLLDFFRRSYFWLQSLIFFGMAFVHFDDERKFWAFTAVAVMCQGWAQVLELLRQRS